MKSYICKCCGAELIADESTNFTSCMYCGNNIAIVNKEYDNLNIKKIIPFSLDKEEAKTLFEKLLKDGISSIKRVYVPVRFCNFEFDYLLYYEHRVENTDSEGHTTVSYYDAETLIDGNVTDELVFGTGTIREITLKDSIVKDERVNYDPVLLKDASIEYSEFLEDDGFIKKLEYNVKDFSKKRIQRDITQVYSENYFVTDVNLESFSTLVPVYVIKTVNGKLYNLSGAKVKEVYDVLNRRQNIKIGVCLGILLLLLIGIVIFKSKEIIYPMALDIAILVIIVKSPSIKERKNYNYEFSLYNYGDNRKKINY